VFEPRLTKRLARARVSLGFGSAAIVLWLAAPTRGTLIVGALIAVAGEALRFWAAGHINKSAEVTASGPYRWFAHPLYVGSALMGAGLAVASDRASVAVIIGVYLATTLTAAIRSEEAFLRDRFGDAYRQYRDRGAVDRSRRFSLARALANREYRALIGLVVALLLLLVKAVQWGAR
jgi:protein-S-isoprenylcysteine O-methyltransferase Ste14